MLRIWLKALRCAARNALSRALSVLAFPVFAGFFVGVFVFDSGSLSCPAGAASFGSSAARSKGAHAKGRQQAAITSAAIGLRRAMLSTCSKKSGREMKNRWQLNVIFARYDERVKQR
ncbi:MAG TPA: hypothetical protein VG125_14630 [Pirellulales bacterium]|nr:hypothetical protein [Pirellulales bacterium]